MPVSPIITAGRHFGQAASAEIFRTHQILVIFGQAVRAKAYLDPSQVEIVRPTEVQEVAAKSEHSHFSHSLIFLRPRPP